MDDFEKRAADIRLRQYRREKLFHLLRGFGLSVVNAEKISEEVWEVKTPWLEHDSHRWHNQGPLVGLKISS